MCRKILRANSKLNLYVLKMLKYAEKLCANTTTVLKIIYFYNLESFLAIGSFIEIFSVFKHSILIIY